MGVDKSGQSGQAQPGQAGVLAGKNFGSYRVGELLGSGTGSFSAVYTAEPTAGGEKVALRVFSTDLSRDKNLAARLVADVQKACAVQHPSLVPVRDVGTADWKGKRLFYIATERLEGESLKSRLARNGGQPLALAEALHIASEVGAALQAIHRSGGTHRSLSLGSVFLARASGERPRAEDDGSAREKVYLLDLANALVPAADGGQGPGKGGKGSKVQEDIRALAQLVHDMLSGVESSPAPSSQAILPLRFRNAKVPARVDAVLRSVLGDALGPLEKNGRFDSPAALIAALLGTGDALPSLGVWSEDGLAPPRPRPGSGNNLLYAALAAVFLGAVVGYWFYAQETPSDAAPPDLATAAPAASAPVQPPDAAALPPVVTAPPAMPAPVVAPELPPPAPRPDAATDGGVPAGRPGAWPHRNGQIPPLRGADPVPAVPAPAPTANGSSSAAVRAPASAAPASAAPASAAPASAAPASAAPASAAPAPKAVAPAPAAGAAAGAPGAPAVPKTQPAAKPPVPSQGPGAAPASPAPVPGLQEEVK